MPVISNTLTGVPHLAGRGIYISRANTTQSWFTTTDSAGTWRIELPTSADSYRVTEPIANSGIRTTQFTVGGVDALLSAVQTSVSDGYTSSDPSTGVGAAFGFYGDGSDGDVTLNGGTTTLTRDMFYRNLIIPAGQILDTNGRRVFVQNLLQNDGVIRRNGANATGATGGGALSAQTVGGSGAGTTGTTGAGTAGTPAGAGFGGTGGAGGNGTPNAGGAAPTQTPPVANRGSLRALPQAAMGLGIGGGSATVFDGGDGGSAGGGDGTNAGGGGGSGAGLIVLCARQLVNNGSISAVGGNGGVPGAGNAGGGGGGGGGAVVLVYNRKSGSGTVSFGGGTGGAKTGTGIAGSNGGTGKLVEIPN